MGKVKNQMDIAAGIVTGKHHIVIIASALLDGCVAGIVTGKQIGRAHV